MVDDTNKIDFAQSIAKLDQINTWFQNEDIDLDEGLQKLREGNDLIKKCRTRLQEVENEFIKIKQEVVQDDRQTELPNDASSQHDDEKETDPNEIPF